MKHILIVSMLTLPLLCKSGLQAKTFCDPDSAHCTLGFRYVIYLEEK